jgi:C-terminal processing protease CtpA/Prc
MKLTKVVDMIRGKKGTKVKLKVRVPKEENEEESANLEATGKDL